MRIGVKPGQWGWTFEELTESWEAAEEAGFDLISCFDHVSSAPAGLRTWDAPTLLAAMAARTQQVGIAVHVLNGSLRHPIPPRGAAGGRAGGQRRPTRGRTRRRLESPRPT